MPSASSAAILDMANQDGEEVIGIPVSSSFAFGGPQRQPFARSRKSNGGWMLGRIKTLRSRADSFVHGVRDHVSVGPKISTTVKGKLSLGARILNAGGFEGVFKTTFTPGEGEKLLKASQCYLSTTAGPVAGVLFVSNEKIAFCSERSVSLSSPKGTPAKVPYKVLIPMKKVKGAFAGANMDKPNQKYLYVVTVDGFEFWFMGFVTYQKTFSSLQQAVSG